MKRLLFVIFTLLLFTFPSVILAQSDTGWVVENFNSDIVLHSDTSATVTETIDVDFGNLAKHGIYRTIPVKYKTRFGNALDIRFDLIRVTDEFGKSYPVSTTHKAHDIELKIGDPDRTITGKHTYIISYSVNRIITTPSENAEFYWNVTGNDWPVSIESVHASVTTEGIRDTICFQGFLGSTTQCSASSTSNIAQFESFSLTPGQGTTISVALDPDVFVFPSWQQNLVWFLTDNWTYVIPFIVFFFMSRMYMIRGRDKRYRNVFHESDAITVPFFEKLNPLMTFSPPKDIPAGEVGVIVDERVNQRDITAVIIDLAIKGFITIKEETKGKILKRSVFTLLNNSLSETRLKSYEVSVMDMLFGKSRQSETSLSKLPKNAYQYIADVRKNLYEQVVVDGYFLTSPAKTRNMYMGVGIFVLLLSIVMGINSQTDSNTYGMFIPLLLSGIIIIVFSFVMPARTAKGRKALTEIVGLKEYIRVGAWRQKEYEKKNFFEEVLPYTICFGMTQKFIKAFKDAEIVKPNWYQSTGSFNPVLFAHSLSQIETNVTQGVAATRPKSASSGGSGFSGGGSGGGFGGGGGGSW